MRRFLVAALAAVIPLVALAACGSDDDTASGPTTLAPDTPVTSPPTDPDAPVEPGGPQRVEPRGGSDGNPIAFDPAEAEATDGAVLVRFWSGVAPCYFLERYEVTETPETVTVSLFSGSDPTAGVCIEIALWYEVLVPLDAPLGDRVLVDGNA